MESRHDVTPLARTIRGLWMRKRLVFPERADIGASSRSTIPHDSLFCSPTGGRSGGAVGCGILNHPFRASLDAWRVRYASSARAPYPTLAKLVEHESESRGWGTQALVDGSSCPPPFRRPYPPASTASRVSSATGVNAQSTKSAPVSRSSPSTADDARGNDPSQSFVLLTFTCVWVCLPGAPGRK
jgi:hypothetical protein